MIAARISGRDLDLRRSAATGRSRTTLPAPLTPLFSRIFVATRGWYRIPPLANAAYADASCSGVTTRSPWPTARFAPSPGSQTCVDPSGLPLLNACLNERSGTRPFASFGQPDAGRAPEPERARHALDAVQLLGEVGALVVGLAVLLPVPEADVVEEHVARHGQGPLQVDDAVGRVLRVVEALILLALPPNVDEAAVVEREVAA